MSLAPVAAIQRFAQRVPVFPCRRVAQIVQTAKGPQTRKAKSPLTEHGFQDASQDSTRIAAWWREHPDAYVGVPTGTGTGFVVIDYDPAKATAATADWIAAHSDVLTSTRVHSTVSGGRHYLFRISAEQHYRGGVDITADGAVRPGLDVRADGGYVIWWPLHGGTAMGDMAPLPAGLIDDRKIEARDLAPLPTKSPEAWARDHQLLIGALPYLDPSSYDVWMRAGLAIHLASGGSDSGFQLWHGWSSGGLTGDAPHSYSGIEDCRYHWASYRHDKDRKGTVTLGSLFKAASDAGWQRPARADPEPPPMDLPPIDAYDEYSAVVVGHVSAMPALRTNKQGPIPDEENIRLILENDSALQGIARFDEFASELILTRPIDAGRVVADRDTPRAWTDADTIALQTYIQRHYIPRIGRDRVEAVIGMHARTHGAFHPVRDYLQGLRWDGTYRLDTWLAVYLGAHRQPAPFLQAVGPRFLIAAVARVLEPGCQVDTAMVLEGDQGIRKSTAWRVLASDAWFSDSLPPDLAHKDARDHLRGKWIIDLSELAQFKRAEIETIKAFISRRHEQYRPSYGRHEVRFPRQCVFAGTTNADSYLVDPTGNRRFWTVACTTVDLAALKRDRDQLWAEAVVRYRNGDAWHLTGDLEQLAATEASQRVQHDPWTAEVAALVPVDDRLDVSPGEILARMELKPEQRHAKAAARVGQILLDLGWHRKPKRHMTRGVLFQRMKHEAP